MGGFSDRPLSAFSYLLITGGGGLAVSRVLFTVFQPEFAGGHAKLRKSEGFKLLSFYFVDL